MDTTRGAATEQQGRLRALLSRGLPQGQLLPLHTWSQRHRVIVALLWLHAAALTAYQFSSLGAPASSGEIAHSLLEIAALVLPALVASTTRASRSLRSAAATGGLLTASAILVHLAGGYIEAHFHIFVIIAIITLYQDWGTFLLAIGFVVVHHGVVGVVSPASVYNHPDAIARPWLWAAIHGAFVLAASAACVVSWRFSEDAHAARTDAERRLRALNGQLERRVAERTAELQSVVSQLESQIEQRRQAEDSVLEMNARLTDTLASLTESEMTVRHQAERLQLLNDFARTVSGTVDLHRLAATIVGQVVTLLGCERCSIVEHDPAAGVLRLAAAHRADGSADLPTGTAQPVDRAIFASVVRSRTTRIVDDVRQIALDETGQRAFAGLRSIACVPILLPDRAWGVLTAAFAEPGAATADRVRFLEGLAAQLAGAIRAAHLYTQLRNAHHDLQATQQQVVAHERLRALGEMASGIAHDLNNALAPVVGFSELLLLNGATLENRETVRRYLSLIHTGASDAAGVVARLREFYRGRTQDDARAPLDLNALVEQVIPLTAPKWKDQALASNRTIAVQSHTQPIPHVLGREQELRELLTNLIFNAVDAMSRGGTITLRTRVEPGAPTSAETVVLEVQDTGVGMTEEVRRRCLEPFFTTKGERGTGLGLAMVYGIVQRHDGTIDVESQPGEGTRFVMRLPAGAATAQPTPPEAPTPTPSLRILVVDDEPAVAAVAAAHLQHDGHHVVTAGSGSEALDALRRDRFDLVFTDKAMPQMPGDRLALLIKQLSPQTPIIMLTGFGDLMAAAGETPAGVDAVVGKPFTAGKLRTAVATVLPLAA